MTDTIRLRIEGIAQPVIFTGCAELIGVLQDLLKQWRVTPLEQSQTGFSLSISREGDKWRCISNATGKDVAYPDIVSAACWLAANLVKCQTLENPGQLCLHAAAIEIGGGLVVMPSRYRAGKSILTATFASMGRRVFGDDILPVDPDTGDGVAAGIAPRLRLPLPETLRLKTKEFIAGHKGPEGAKYLYLDLPDALFAPRGMRLPIRGFVLLDREDDGPATLSRVPEGDALKQVIWQNFGREGPAAAILERLADIAARAPCLHLTYSRPEEGARAVIDAFEAPSLDHIRVEPFQLDVERAKSKKGRIAADIALDEELIRTSGCELQIRAGRNFLIGAEGLTIMALDDIGAAVWRLLETATSYADVFALVAAAFPDEDASRVDADLRTLIGDFLRNQAVEVF